MSPESPQTRRSRRHLELNHAPTLLLCLMCVLAQLTLGCDSHTRQTSPIAKQQTPVIQSDVSLAKWHDYLKDAPITIRTHPDIDEREMLFFHYNKLLEGLSLWPSDNVAKLASLSALRDRGNLCCEYLRQNKSDPRMISLFTDLVAFVDAYSDFVIKQNQIDRYLSNRANQEAAEASFNSGKLGGQAAMQMYIEGASGKQSTFAGLVVGAANYYFDSLQKQNALDETRKNAIELAKEEFTRRISVLSAREKNTIDWLASQFHWKRDYQGKYLDKYTILMKQLGDKYATIKTIEDSLSMSKSILEAAKYLPPGSIYDEYRGMALQLAARTETWAAERYLKGQKWGSQSSPIILHALRLWDASSQYPEFNFNNELGKSFSGHAWALGIAGRFTEAVQEANKVFSKRNTSPSFLYNYVRLCCYAGIVDTQTLSNLRVVLAHGVFADDLDNDNMISLNTIRNDIHLEPLRTRLREQYADLMQVKATWYIQYGLLNNDLVMVNQSAFPLTNIQLRLRIETNESVWEPVRTLSFLNAGKSYTWEKFDSTLSKSKVNKSTATLTCDQRR